MERARDADVRGAEGEDDTCRGWRTHDFFSPCPDQLLVWGGCSERSLHPGVLLAVSAPSPASSFSQSGSSPAQAPNLCKVLAYCLILRSTIAPALPGTCRDLDAF